MHFGPRAAAVAGGNYRKRAKFETAKRIAGRPISLTLAALILILPKRLARGRAAKSFITSGRSLSPLTPRAAAAAAGYLSYSEDGHGHSAAVGHRRRATRCLKFLKVA